MPLFGPPDIDKLKRKRDVAGLLKALGHKDAAVQLSAENALNELGTAIVGPLASIALHAWTANIRRAATETLRKLGPGEMEAIIDAIEEEHPTQAAELLKDLGGLETEAVEALISDLEDEGGFARLWTAWVLAEMQDARGVEAIIAALSDEDEDVREAAADTLEQIGGPAAEQALERYRAQE